jgi:hypothetical protein
MACASGMGVSEYINLNRKGGGAMSAFEIAMIVLTALPLAVKAVKSVINFLDKRYKK